jgi:hypothetical protein
MRTATLGTFLPLVLSVAGCMAKVGAEDVSVPEDAASNCASQCESIGLRLGAVALMANTVGCVCQLPTPGMQRAALSESGTITAGMATIMMQEETRQQERQQQPSAQ